jgi:hypothetical protein
MVNLKDQAPHALPHGAFFRIDPQDRGALRQGNIALIHSAPTGDTEIRHSGAMRSIEPE